MALTLGLAGPGSAQDARVAEVRTSLEETLAAWKGGDFQTFAAFYHPAARGFFLDGGPRLRGFQVATLEAAWDAGFRTELELRDVEIAFHGDVAVVSAYLTGTLTLPGGGSLPGSWRYTETRVPADGDWKVLQYHFSRQEEAPVGGG
jgi:ketosteroid isomerase-like protein